MQADRREFLTWSAGGAFVLAVNEQALAQPAVAPRPGSMSPWFKVLPNGRVTVLSNAVEMGQGAHTGHAAILADELDVPWDMIDVEMVDMANHSGAVATGGSRSIRGTFAAARRAGASARAQFIQAAAQQWNVAPAQCETAGGRVVNKATRASLSYGQLAEAAAAVPAPTDVALKDAAARAFIGKPVQSARVKLKTNGQEQYGMDVRLPGMLRASIRQTPTFGARLESVDEGPAMAIPGVRKVVRLDAAVAVVATDTWTAIKAVRALDPKWTTPDVRGTNADFRQRLVDAHAAALAAAPSAQAAPLRAAYDAAAKKVEASYDLAHLAHVTMEPQNCTAHVTADRIEIWGPTQVPSAVVGGAANWAGKPGTRVVLHTTMLGGGFGRRLNTDYVQQAVQIAAQVDAPVQLVWTREEDFTHDVYRTAVRQTYRAGLNADGLIEGYETITAATDTQVRGGMAPAPYAAIKAHALTQTPAVRAGVPFGYWRSVDEGMSTWGRESFIDECAVAAGIDPVEYRLRLLGDNARARRLLNAVADRIGWKSPRPAGIGRGVAIGEGFGSITAHAVEVEVKGDALTVRRIVVASDLGVVVAPSQVRAQYEGGALMGLGAALSEGMSFTDGKANETNFNQYRTIRMKQSPPVEVILFETPDVPLGGAGEPPVPTVAPALANAVYQASGRRVRSLPFAKAGFTV